MEVVVHDFGGEALRRDRREDYFRREGVWSAEWAAEGMAKGANLNKGHETAMAVMMIQREIFPVATAAI